MKETLRFTWERFSLIASIVGDIQSRFIATLFYFTFLVPFGLISRFFSDPMHMRPDPDRKGWLTRPPVGNQLDDAKNQG